ncbi:hypothetical protein [Adhaeribacter aquaticus]|uniref:hypothetical protein n=1 Tax=Adhaeribacter aquaticus TaxID=299567 RepID=UPI0004238967|nr:hypothetical protein [Adhaeribacter aquaticus]
MLDNLLQVYQNDFATISLVVEEFLLVLEWRRHVDFAERKEGLLIALTISKENKINYWIIDDLYHGYISFEEKEWLLSEWMQRISGSGIQKIAYLARDYFSALAVNLDFRVRIITEYKERSNIENEIFIDYPTALTWLFPE